MDQPSSTVICNEVIHKFPFHIIEFRVHIIINIVIVTVKVEGMSLPRFIFYIGRMFCGLLWTNEVLVVFVG